LAGHLAKGSAKNSKIIREYENLSSGNCAKAGDGAIAIDFLDGRVIALVHDVLVKFHKSAFVNQECDSFARRKLALGVLGLYLFVSASTLSGLFHRRKSLDFFFVHRDVSRASKSLYKFVISAM